MTWNNASKVRICCFLVLITFCSGCFTSMSRSRFGAKEYYDLSDPSADTAQLRAGSLDIGFAGVYCYMTAPAHAERVTVNAGTVNVHVVCETTDMDSPGLYGWPVDRASFSFDALAGHEYVITSRYCDACVKLKDQTTKEVVGEYPLSDPPRLGLIK